jgi:hypothetical protein
VNVFEKALEFALQWEGGFVNDPDDPGGATNYGVTLRTLRDAGYDIDGDGDVDVDDIRNLDLGTVAKIYREKYWNVINADSLDNSLAIAAFDTAINCGAGRVNRWLNQCDDWQDMLNLRNIHYLTIIKKNPVLKKYQRGWMNRVNDLKKFITILESESSQ